LDSVRLHEHTRVARIDDGRLETERGVVRARDVVVATNAAAAGWQPLKRRLTAFGSYVVLTEPVPELLERIGWTGGEAIFDGRMFLHYFRTTNDGRVLMGSGSGPASPTSPRACRSSRAARRSPRRSRSAASAAASSAPRSSRAKRPRSKVASRPSRRGQAPRCRACSECASELAEYPHPRDGR